MAKDEIFVKHGIDSALEDAAKVLLDHPKEHGILSDSERRTIGYREVQQPPYMTEFQVREYHCKACQLRERIATLGK